MNQGDILMWTDGFWCFREEFNDGFLRDDNFRVVPINTDEWHVITRLRGS